MARRATVVLGAVLALGIAVGVVTASSTAAGAAVPQNQSPPAIQGTAQEGRVLQADHGRWSSGSAIDYSYQWRRCLAAGSGCVDVLKATDRIYAVRGDDVAHTLRLVVTARNKEGASSAISAATAAVT